MGVQEIVIPYTPRKEMIEYHDRTQRFACIVAHRRYGKTVGSANDLQKDCLQCPREAPRFAYIAPTYAQAKDVVWEYLKRFAAPIPGVSFHESELRVDYPNGGRIRLYGAENYERLRGLYLDGIVLDEYGDIDPRAWAEVIRPALADRQGRATFIGTPKGENHFAEVYRRAMQDPDWFSLTLRASETGVLLQTELDAARREMTPNQYAREFECSFAAATEGAIFAAEVEIAEREKRIGKVPRDPLLQVHTSWDLGIDDATAVWFWQQVGAEVRAIDYMEVSGEPLHEIARRVLEKRYNWGQHILPHDVEVRELGTGKSRKEMLTAAGLADIVVAPALPVQDGIEAARVMLAKMWFDTERCGRGLQCLRNYRREFDDKRKVFKDKPLHDWTSHAADALRYFCIMRQIGRYVIQPDSPHLRYDTDYSSFG